MKNNIHPVEAEELMAYLDGELPVERASFAAAHLQECRECQIVAAELKSVSESLTAWEIEPKEPAINAELAAALDERGTAIEEAAPTTTSGLAERVRSAVRALCRRRAGRRRGHAAGRIRADVHGSGPHAVRAPVPWQSSQQQQRQFACQSNRGARV